MKRLAYGLFCAALVIAGLTSASAQVYGRPYRTWHARDSHSRRDLRNDYRQLDQLERRVQEDEWRLREDRRRHAPRFVIQEDKNRVKYDRRALEALRRDIRRDERGYR